MTEAASSPLPAARDILKYPDFIRFLGIRWLGTIGSQIQGVAMGWQVYALARQHGDVREAALQLGWLGLAAFIPLFFLSLPAGWAADRFERRTIALLCLLGEAITVAILLTATVMGHASAGLLIAVAAAFGASRAFFAPSTQALGPMLVPKELLPRTIAFTTLGWHIGGIAGPAIGGLLVAISPAFAYGVGLAIYAVTALTLLSIRTPTRPTHSGASPLTLVKEGLDYVWREKIVFGSISLDLFAVLLGGATALLPVFAKDVLNVGAAGFGILRAAPAIGATCVGLYLAAHPTRSKAGLVMLSGVAIFGVATIVFGLSTSFWLSVAALASLGGADMLSVFVRHTLIQVVTPDNMRGRVSAVATVFVGASNELGEFESGVAARLLGPVGAAVFGGAGALVVTGLWAVFFPTLRKADKLV